jgi:hypothetical protein
MASKRRLRVKSCIGKIRHSTLGAAWIAAGKTGGDVRPYKCRFCGGNWHVGHEPGKQQRRRQNGHGT